MPLTINFIGELMCYIGGMEVNKYITILGTISIIVNGGYTIYLYNKKILGERKIEKGVKDIGREDTILLIPMIILIYLL